LGRATVQSATSRRDAFGRRARFCVPRSGGRPQRGARGAPQRKAIRDGPATRILHDHRAYGG